MRRELLTGNGNGHALNGDAQIAIRSVQPTALAGVPMDTEGMHGLLDDLTALDLARMTPLEAIAMLDRVQRRARLVLGAPTLTRGA